MIIGPKGVVKLPSKCPVFQDRLELGQELLNGVRAGQGIPAWVVDNEVIGVEIIERLHIAGIDEIDLPPGQQFVGMHGRHLPPQIYGKY